MENKKDTTVKKTKKSNKPNVFVRMATRAWGKIKEIFSELKKVTWPSFSTVVKQLGCVLAIVVTVLVIIMLMDFGLQALLTLVRGGEEAVATILGVL